MKKIYFLVLLIVSVTGACNREKKERGDVSVFRSVLDGIPRMITVALHPDLWVAYNADNGQIYKVWKGGVKLEGAVYNTIHGPQPSSFGYVYYLDTALASSWTIEKDASPQNTVAKYKGYSFENGNVSFIIELTSATEKLTLSENVIFIQKKGKIGFKRIFKIQHIPSGINAVLHTRITSLASPDDYTIIGNFTPKTQYSVKKGERTLTTIEGTLSVDANPTEIQIFYPILKEEIESETESLTEHTGKNLIAKNDCKTCHNEKVKTIGPSYLSIARKYSENTENIQRLSDKIIQGGKNVWGDVPMTPHPSLKNEDAQEMVKYILTLDDNEQKGDAALWHLGEKSLPINWKDTKPEIRSSQKGFALNLYTFEGDTPRFSILEKTKPIRVATTPFIHLLEPSDFYFLQNVYIEINANIHIPKTSSYLFRIASDDGSRLYIDGRKIIDNWGYHGAEPKDGEIYLNEGIHTVKITFFQAGGGAALSFQWFNNQKEAFEIIPDSLITHNAEDFKETKPYREAKYFAKSIPGDKIPLNAVHPSFSVYQARPDNFMPKVGGMDFLSNKKMVISTWDETGSVYLIENHKSHNPELIKVKKIAYGLAEPLGLKIVNDTIYVLQKQELTQLIDRDGDDIIDEYRNISNNWKVSSNFHEFAFGLLYKDGYFYANLATAILPGGASANPQIPDRGKTIKIHKQTGEVEFIARGLRTPNGIGFGVDNEIFVSDNQGDWLPSSKILHLSQNAFFGSHSVSPEETQKLKEKPPVVWLPQDEIGNSPSEIAPINIGVYKGQMIHGEVTHGGIKRVFAEKINGEYQGAVFRFTQGLEAGVNRIKWLNDSSLYIGGIGSSGNWSHNEKKWYGLQRMEYNGKTAFEMLAIRSKANGFEIEFTLPIKEGQYITNETFVVHQWWYKPTKEYGGPKMDLETLRVKKLHLSEDRKKIFLELQNLKPQHVVYFRITDPFIAENETELWSTEAWYTLNNISAEKGFVRPLSIELNALTETEKKNGWELLFDGKTTKGWHTFGKQTIGTRWKVINGELTFLGKSTTDTSWQSSQGGDIVTDAEYKNYELYLEWKISKGGNSGIMIHSQENESYNYPWETGIEMQILDNALHDDANYEKHRAGDIYDLISCKFITVNPAEQWNKVRIISQNGNIQHWLNGYKVSEYNIDSPEWKNLINNSKFAKMLHFGKNTKGKIALQDHGDKVSFRNIKIKEM